jgi:hypothetical protein
MPAQCPVSLMVEHRPYKTATAVRFCHGVPNIGDIAQLVEQRIENPCVTGSTPVIATSLG